tara:strand:+ start:699 stop:1223 length:525 start_codon:yes stop_codon:yes gene_type:complete
MDPFTEITEHLIDFKYPKTTTRKNILNEGDKSYSGFCLGKVISWAHKDENGNNGNREVRDCVKVTQEKYQKIYQLACSLALRVVPDFQFTTIQFNKNYQCKKHIDKNNVGVSRIIGLGDYEGGELLIYYDGEDEEPKSIDIKNKFFEFDGSKYYHETAPFTGERHTLVYYTVKI